MKLNRLFCIAGIFSASAFAGQAFGQSSSQPPQTGTATREFTNVSPQKYSQTLVTGNFSLNRYYTKAGTDYAVSYTITTKSGQVLAVKLNKQSFDEVFQQTGTGVSSKWEQVNKYVKDRDISLTDEKGWISVVNYYNRL